MLSLARTFGAHVLVVSGTHGIWPGVLATGGPDTACFVPIDLGGGVTPGTSGAAASTPTTPLADTHAYRISCGP